MNNFSRRDFLKVMLTSLGAFLASCLPKAKETEIPPTDTPPTEPPQTQPPETEAPEPTEPPTEAPATEAPVLSEAEGPATEEPFCFQLLTPENEAVLPMVGKVTFSWEPMPGADKYLLEITLPNDTVVPFETQLTYRDQYLESITLGGRFTWQVTAFDADGLTLCTTEAFSFEKPAFEQPKNNGGGDSSSSSSGSNSPGSSGAFSSGSPG